MCARDGERAARGVFAHELFIVIFIFTVFDAGRRGCLQFITLKGTL